MKTTQTRYEVAFCTDDQTDVYDSFSRLEDASSCAIRLLKKNPDIKSVVIYDRMARIGAIETRTCARLGGSFMWTFGLRYAEAGR